MDRVRIKPIDILHLRGNRLFAESAYGESVMPPWPSLFSGALRSRILADQDGVERFSEGNLEGVIADVIGRGVENLGSFRLSHVCLERNIGNGKAQLLFPVPADLVVLQRKPLKACRLTVTPISDLGLLGSFALPGYASVLRTKTRDKPQTGYWITVEGYAVYQKGGTPSPDHFVHCSELWANDPRLGIGLSADTRTVVGGLLYTSQAVSMAPGISFVVGIRGEGGLLPRDGLVWLGGEGRGASVESWKSPAGIKAPWSYKPSGDRFSMVMATPGIFPKGWLPPGIVEVNDAFVWNVNGLKAKLVCASLPRGEVISGWDLVKKRPKLALRVIPSGSVYWFERLEGDIGELQAILDEGLWPLIDNSDRDAARRAEGFNNVWFGNWAEPGENSICLKVKR